MNPTCLSLELRCQLLPSRLQFLAVLAATSVRSVITHRDGTQRDAHKKHGKHRGMAAGEQDRDGVYKPNAGGWGGQPSPLLWPKIEHTSRVRNRVQTGRGAFLVEPRAGSATKRTQNTHEALLQQVAHLACSNRYGNIAFRRRKIREARPVRTEILVDTC